MLIARAGAAAALASAIIGFASAPRLAAGDAALAVRGTEQSSPGVAVTPSDQSIVLRAELVGAAPGSGGVVRAACRLAGGSDIPETPARGAGTIYGSCAGPGFAADCARDHGYFVDYLRLGAAEVVNGLCAVNGVDTMLRGELSVTPSGTSTTTYIVVGAVAF